LTREMWNRYFYVDPKQQLADESKLDVKISKYDEINERNEY
jgi:hypothetical protein